MKRQVMGPGKGDGNERDMSGGNERRRKCAQRRQWQRGGGKDSKVPVGIKPRSVDDIMVWLVVEGGGAAMQS